jgi:hypothetical protein
MRKDGQVKLIAVKLTMEPLTSVVTFKSFTVLTSSVPGRDDDDELFDSVQSGKIEGTHGSITSCKKG